MCACLVVDMLAQLLSLPNWYNLEPCARFAYLPTKSGEQGTIPIKQYKDILQQLARPWRCPRQILRRSMAFLFGNSAWPALYTFRDHLVLCILSCPIFWWCRQSVCSLHSSAMQSVADGDLEVWKEVDGGKLQGTKHWKNTIYLFSMVAFMFFDVFFVVCVCVCVCVWWETLPLRLWVEGGGRKLGW